jgi:hypothetical protein
MVKRSMMVGFLVGSAQIRALMFLDFPHWVLLGFGWLSVAAHPAFGPHAFPALLDSPALIL